MESEHVLYKMYLGVGKPQIPIAIRMAMKASISLMVICVFPHSAEEVYWRHSICVQTCSSVTSKTGGLGCDDSVAFRVCCV